MSNTQTWDRRFIELAALVATWSKDTSTRIGAVIVGPGKDVRSLGFNGFPRGVDDSVKERYERPLKYLWTVHSEENALLNALRNNVSVIGCTIYLNGFPCAPCARAIVQSGIIKLVGFKPNFDDPRWGEEYKETLSMFQESGVSVKTLLRKEFPGQELPEQTSHVPESHQK
jgi:dCMP deaminase